MAEATQAFKVTVPLTNPGAYTTGQAIGTTLTFSQMGIGGIIDYARLGDVGQSGAIDLVLYHSAPGTPAGDRTTFAGAPDRGRVIGIISFAAAGYIALGALAGQCPGTGLPIQSLATRDSNLYGQLVARGTITIASNDLIVYLGRSF